MTWYNGTKLLFKNQRVHIWGYTIDDEHMVNGTLRVTDLRLWDTRQFSCKVLNHFGEDRSYFRITAQGRKAPLFDYCLVSVFNSVGSLWYAELKSYGHKSPTGWGMVPSGPCSPWNKRPLVLALVPACVTWIPGCTVCACFHFFFRACLLTRLFVCLLVLCFACLFVCLFLVDMSLLCYHC